MDMHTRVAAQKAEIIFQLRHVLSPADQLADVIVERLHADFELERARRKLRDQAAQRFRQTVRDHLEMKEEAGLIAFQEELQQRATDVEIQVEGAINELEMYHPAIEQLLQFGQETFERRLADGNVE